MPGRLNKNDFDEQASVYDEKKYSRKKSGRNVTKGAIKDELDAFMNADEKVQQNNSKGKLILFAVIGGVLLLIIVLTVVLLLGSGTQTATSTEEPTRYESPTIIKDKQKGYTEDQIESLRAAGYTGDEIETYERNGDDVEQLLNFAQEKKDEEIRQRYEYLIENIPNKELKAIIENTYYVNPQAKIPPMEKDENGEYVDPVPELIQENADYWKVPLHGHQAQVKLKLKSKEIVFVQIPISRYATLRESGNMVIRYNKLTFPNTKQVIIQDIQEVRAETGGLN